MQEIYIPVGLHYDFGLSIEAVAKVKEVKLLATTTLGCLESCLANIGATGSVASPRSRGFEYIRRVATQESVRGYHPHRTGSLLSCRLIYETTLCSRR